MVSSAWKNKRVRGAMDSVLGLLGSRRQQNPHGPRHRVVVIGGGFAGLAVAHNLGEECDVVVVEIKRWLEFTPSARATRLSTRWKSGVAVSSRHVSRSAVVWCVDTCSQQPVAAEDACTSASASAALRKLSSIQIRGYGSGSREWWR